MKKIIYNALMIACLLPCGYALAGEIESCFPVSKNCSSDEEFRASWEGEAGAELIGEEFIISLKSGRIPALKLNALCSFKSMAEMKRLRGSMTWIIERDKASGFATAEGIVAARILGRVASLDITGINHYEKNLIETVNSLPAENKPYRETGVAGGAFPFHEISINIPVPAVNSSGSRILFFVKNGDKYNLNLNVEAPGRSFEIAHADYYRLFLYMRDDTGDSHFRNNRNQATSLFPHSFYSLTLQKQNQITEQKSNKVRGVIFITGIILSKALILFSAGSGINASQIQIRDSVPPGLFILYRKNKFRKSSTPSRPGGTPCRTVVPGCLYTSDQNLKIRMEDFYEEA